MKTIERNGVKFSLEEARAILRADWWGSEAWGVVDADDVQHLWPAAKLAKFRGAAFERDVVHGLVPVLSPTETDTTKIVAFAALADIAQFLGYSNTDEYIDALERMEGKILDPLREAMATMTKED